MLELDYVLDPETGEPHMYKHKVYEDDVEHLFSNEPEHGVGHEGASTATGPDGLGHVICAVFRGDIRSGKVLVITAYRITNKQERAFWRREHKRKR